MNGNYSDRSKPRNIWNPPQWGLDWNTPASWYETGFGAETQPPTNWWDSIDWRGVGKAGMSGYMAGGGGGGGFLTGAGAAAATAAGMPWLAPLVPLATNIVSDVGDWLFGGPPEKKPFKGSGLDWYRGQKKVEQNRQNRASGGAPNPYYGTGISATDLPPEGYMGDEYYKMFNEIADEMRERIAAGGIGLSEEAQTNIYQTGKRRAGAEYKMARQRSGERMASQGLGGSGIYNAALSGLDKEEVSNLMALSNQISLENEFRRSADLQRSAAQLSQMMGTERGYETQSQQFYTQAQAEAEKMAMIKDAIRDKARSRGFANLAEAAGLLPEVPGLPDNQFQSYDPLQMLDWWNQGTPQMNPQSVPWWMQDPTFGGMFG